MDEMTLHRKRRLRALIEAAPYNGSQLAFAQAAKLSEGRVSQLVDPKHSFGERSARNIANELRLDGRYFEQGYSADAESITIPRLDVIVAAGDGRVTTSEEVVEGLAFRADFLRECGIYAAEDGVVLNVRGESMGLTVPDGAVLLVNKKGREPLKKKVFVFLSGEGPVVKRVLYEGGRWMARSDNEDKSTYPDFPFDDGHALIGRAVWMGAKL
ncbi:S24 family peptidase [Acidovorax sp. LjRoot66]|uniref:S24 family peptidase n=1 Tax=Acidovorax sp. LjRoot66 TaxID=3342334 RepID=UPI003ECC2120